MNHFEEILALRESENDAVVLSLIAKAFAATPTMRVSGPEHQWLIDALAFDHAASNRSFKFAVRKYPAFTAALITRCRMDEDSTVVASLLESLVEGKPKAVGAVREAFSAERIAERVPTHLDPKARAGVMGAMQAMGGAMMASVGTEVEMELSFAWGIVEGMVLDGVAPVAHTIDCVLPASMVIKRTRVAAIAEAFRHQTAAEMCAAFFTDRSPHILAHPSDDEDAAVSPEALTAVRVHHHRFSKPLAASQRGFLQSHAAAKQIAKVYAAVNGAALFCTQHKDWGSAGFMLLPDTDWYSAHCEVMNWLEAVDFQEDPSQIPGWVKTAIPFGKVPGDASYWILLVEGPYAGTVMLSHDDVSDEEIRYPSFDVFMATLRLFPEAILGCGGYVSYDDPISGDSLYPQGYRTGNTD
jgi:hypothetical protein